MKHVLFRRLAAAGLSSMLTVSCATTSATERSVENAWPDGPGAPTLVKVWYRTTLWERPIAPGTQSEVLRVGTGEEPAYAVLRIGERQFLAVSRDAIVTLAGTEGVLSFSPTVSRGACATTEPLSKDEYDFAATRIFPGEAVEPFGAKCP